PAGAATTLAGTQCRPPRARGGRGWAPRRGRDPLAGRPLEPVGPPGGGGGGRGPSQGSGACRRARPTRGSAVVCLGGRRRGGYGRGRRAGPGAAGAHATAVA